MNHEAINDDGYLYIQESPIEDIVLRGTYNTIELDSDNRGETITSNYVLTSFAPMDRFFLLRSVSHHVQFIIKHNNKTYNLDYNIREIYIPVSRGDLVEIEVISTDNYYSKISYRFVQNDEGIF